MSEIFLPINMRTNLRRVKNLENITEDLLIICNNTITLTDNDYINNTGYVGNSVQSIDQRIDRVYLNIENLIKRVRVPLCTCHCNYRK